MSSGVFTGAVPRPKVLGVFVLGFERVSPGLLVVVGESGVRVRVLKLAFLKVTRGLTPGTSWTARRGHPNNFPV